MKKTLLLSAMILMAIFATNAQDVIKLGVNDSIGYAVKNYTGTATSLTVVVPSGYTSPEALYPAGAATSPKTITLAPPTTVTKITIKGDGTNPTLRCKLVSTPAYLSLIKFDGLNVQGATSDPTVNYVMNFPATTAVTLDSVVFTNCSFNTFRSLLRFQNANAATSATQKANNIIINNCVVSNFADYGVTYNSTTGGFFGAVKVAKSTFYGFGATVFMLQKNSTSIDITDCSFDNVVGTSGKGIVDCGSMVANVTFTNCILGKAQAAGAITIKTGGTLTITNSYYTTDWTGSTSTATAGITGALTAYTGASTDLFTTVSVSTAAVAGPPAIPYTTTVGNYKIKDATFAGKNSVGDPRWYYNSIQAVNSVLADKGVSFNGTEVVNSKGLDIEVYNMLGKKVATSKTNISTTNFTKGIYVVRVNGINDSLKFSI